MAALNSVSSPGLNQTLNRMIRYEPSLVRQTVQDDIFAMSSQIIGSDQISRSEKGLNVYAIPTQAFMDIGSQKLKGTTRVRLAFVSALGSDGASGTTTMQGNSTYEEPLDYKGITIHANTRRKAVPTYGDGPYMQENDFYKVDKAVNGIVAQWVKDDIGYGIRHAIAEGIAPWLESAPASLTATLHKNIITANTEYALQPFKNYSSTAATWADTVATQAQAIPVDGTGGITWENIHAWEEYCDEMIIGKIEGLSGGPGRIFCHSARGRTQMMKNDDFKEILSQADVRGPKNQILAGLKGPIGSFYFYVDQRLPRADCSGDPGSGTVSMSYHTWGRTDNRAGLFDPNLILGPGAVVKGTAIAPHYVEQMVDYGMLKGLGVSRTEAIMRLQYDKDTATDTSMDLTGSALILTRRAEA